MDASAQGEGVSKGLILCGRHKWMTPYTQGGRQNVGSGDRGPYVRV